MAGSVWLAITLVLAGVVFSGMAGDGNTWWWAPLVTGLYALYLYRGGRYGLFFS